MRRLLLPLVMVALPGVTGCDWLSGGDSAASSTTAASASASALAEAGPPRLRALLEAELSRRADGVREEDLSSRHVDVRRAAARALARIRGVTVREGLLRLLADEDPTVVAWAAYGLGDSCAGHREETVAALVTARASLSSRLPDAGASGPLDPQRAIIRAVGRCASGSSEQVLIGWARKRGPHAVDAIQALGDVARERKRLREETFVALLELASGNASQAPLPWALYPFGRVEFLPPSVVERTLEVSAKRLATKGKTRVFAIKALARSGDDALPRLRAIAETRADYSAAERAEAARGMARFGRRGQRALGAVLRSLPIDDVAALVEGAEAGVVLTMLGALTYIGKTRMRLDQLAKLEPPKGAEEAIRRRVSWVRCSAAQLLAERNFTMPLLRACDLSVPEDERNSDPIGGSIAARAVVAAIGVDGVKLTGKRLEAWRAYATKGEPRARQAAISLIGPHAEIGDAAEVLAAALSAKAPGVVASAAEVIAKHPERAMQKGKKGETVHPAVAEALTEALEAESGPASDVETRAEVIDAVAALKLKAVQGRLQKLCVSPREVLRDHAIEALAKLLGDPKAVRCGAPEPLPLPDELSKLVAKPVRVKLDSSVGELSLALDPSYAPVAVSRVAELVDAGFYDGMVVHRVVPGFVAQFGSPTADGYGGAPGKPALPCETTPLPFETHSVGMALAGRDTGSSQLFVTAAPFPHLDGEYALLGKAEGPWEALVDGDVIRDAERVK